MAGPKAWLAGPQAWLDGPEGGRTNERNDGKSPHSTGLCPLLGPLPNNEGEREEEEEEEEETGKK